MTLIKNIFIVLVVAVLLIVIINTFVIRTNIIWDDLVQGQTGQGGVPSSEWITSSSNISIPSPSVNSKVTISKLVQDSGKTGLIVPNSAFPNIMASNFMFSIWFFIDDLTENLGQIKYIASTIGILSSKFAPTLMTFLSEYNNNLGIGVRTQTSDTDSGQLNFYYIENIPLQKWNCLIISVVNRTMDVYLDGKLINSFILQGFFIPAPQTSLYVGGNNNNYFSGFITRARIDNGGVNPQEAYSIYKEGIRTSYAGDFLNKYRLKVGLYEYNNKVGGFTV